jgi:Rieske Fe-S protein
MERRDFIRNCGFICFGGVAYATLLQSCATTKTVQGQIDASWLVIDLKEFETVKKGVTDYHKYVIVHNDALQYPICVYRFSDSDFRALYMQCTHQGAELQVFGDKIQCPAHGSEFSNTGAVENGPATQHLRTFQTLLSSTQLKISLT